MSDANAVELASSPGLDRRVTILRCGSEVDAMFVRTERFGVLVDTLSTPALCRQALQLLEPQLAGGPLLVVNSHLDWDHCWGNAAIRDRAPILAHAAALDRIDDAATLLEQRATVEPRFRGFAFVPPTLTFSNSLRIDGGDLRLELLPTPGHTPDHLIVWMPEIRTCLAIDAVEDPIPEVWSDDPQDLADLRASLRIIQELGAEFVLPAHGWTSSPELVDRNIAYFDALAERTRGLGNDALQRSDLATLSGLRFVDLLPQPRSMSPATLQFYHGCHARNLAAAARSELQHRGTA